MSKTERKVGCPVQVLLFLLFWGTFTAGVKQEPGPSGEARGLEMCRLQRGRSSLLLCFVCKHVGPQRASLAAGWRAGS